MKKFIIYAAIIALATSCVSNGEEIRSPYESPKEFYNSIKDMDVIESEDVYIDEERGIYILHCVQNIDEKFFLVIHNKNFGLEKRVRVQKMHYGIDRVDAYYRFKLDDDKYVFDEESNMMLFSKNGLAQMSPWILK